MRTYQETEESMEARRSRWKEERQQEITDYINSGWIMVQTYYHQSDVESFCLVDLNATASDIELTTQEWDWITDNFQYESYEVVRPMMTEVTYFFETRATEVA